jgi:predicted alpha/beta-fold hydrolase
MAGIKEFLDPTDFESRKQKGWMGSSPLSEGCSSSIMLSKIAAASVVVIGLLLATSSGKEKPLASLRANPSPFYPTSLYPNSTSVESPYGFVQYALFGPEHGEKIVFVHGYSCPSPIFEKISKGLAEDGYRVLTYDLWGRGYSDSPASVYNEGLYMAQLEFLIQQVGWSDTTFNVVGLSLGGKCCPHHTQI